MTNMRIYHQSFTVLANLPPYAEAMAAHFTKVAAPGTEVVMHGMHRDTYQTNYPGNDIQFAYFQTLHSQQFVLGALAAEEQGFDAFALMTLPEPSLQDIRALVDIPVVGYGESAMLAASMLGQNIGVLLFITGMAPTVQRNAARMGMAERFIGAHPVGFGFNDVLAAYADPAPLLERFRASARALIAKGADVIIPGEAPLCMLLARGGVSEVDGVPIVDAIAATVKMAEMMVGLRRVTGVRPCRTGYFQAQPPRERVRELLEFYGISRIAGG
ncbi:Asp/Glu/hydantoin racemase [Humitalea rosea]|uniref:Asp/Glu/hydantoin racemase n=1 Tax=Humitalea rosea TaxID=990373 RepID=A0A2W7ITX2_9PROT|nr:aspartate/glutamate racemase family protein [Humitalea rosea]PZW50909.1 Asp/Glu/hydantoin racemase [Humitalea rosea]